MNAPDFIKPEELLRVLFQSPNATAVYAGSNITILSANAEMLSLWGKDRNVIGKAFQDAIPELKDQPLLGILQDVWSSGKTYIAVDQPAMLNVDGRLQLFYFDFEYKAILDERGQIEYILHTAFEVSVRIAANEKIREKSHAEKRLSDELTALNEEYQAANEDLSTLNEEYQAANESLATLNEEYLVANEQLMISQHDLQLLNAQLKESEERFRSLVAHAPVAIAIYRGEDMVIEQANISMLCIWGQTEQVIGMPLLEARPQLIGHDYIDIIRKVLSDGQTHYGYNVKGPVVKNGMMIDGYFDVTYKPIPAKNGAVSGIIVVAADVTERALTRLREEEINEEVASINEELMSSNEELVESQQQQRELYEILNVSEKRFRTMIEQSPIAMAYLKGRDFLIDVVNEAILEIWGKDRSVINSSLAAAVPEIKEQSAITILQEVYDTGETFYGREIKVVVCIDGQLVDRVLNFVYQCVKGPDNKSIAILMIASDVTEQVEARKAVDDINTRLQIALDASNLGSTEVNIATGKMQSTDQFKRNYGFLPEEEFTYADLFNSMLPDHRERVRGLVAEAIKTNSVYQAEYPVRWRDGSMHWIKAHGRPRYDENGRADRMVGMTADITAAKEFEQRKDDFLSIASHELKTPITSLKASIQLLERMKDKQFSAIHTKLIEQSHKSVEKMGVLVDDLLNMSRMSEEQLRLERKTFNLYDMLSMSCSHVRLEDRYELVLNGDQTINVFADEHRIDQVVINFVNNAVKYAPESRKIDINLARLDGHIKVSVRDYGRGIAAEVLPNLFDRYYRIDHSGKAYTGLGLGLYICSEIIKKHGGKIGAESLLGEGSTFWFTLPV